MLLYVATAENEEFLGHAPSSEIAYQIYHSIGPSGPNLEYFLNLVNVLDEMGIKEDHIIELHKEIIYLQSKNNNEKSSDSK